MQALVELVLKHYVGEKVLSMKRRRNVFRGNVLQVVFAWHGATVQLKIQPMKVAESG